MYVNHEALAPSTLAVWARGGLDTLVKIAPIGTRPDPARFVGFCTTLRFLVGRSPVEMEQIVRLDTGMRLVNGVDIFKVSPLPSPSEFELKGYSTYQGEVVSAVHGSVSHPTYPPGRGAPQWELAGVSQARLVWIASVACDKVFTFEAKRLAPTRAADPH